MDKYVTKDDMRFLLLILIFPLSLLLPCGYLLLVIWFVVYMNLAPEPKGDTR